MLNKNKTHGEGNNLLEDYLSKNSSLSRKNPKLQVKFKMIGIKETRITSMAIHNYMKKLNDKN
ncbi:hypothetical protein ACSBL2_25140 [Pedobacter sp. AW31-3R]|uniref:hypothetical protein n=1 Tax=Pedobacter sp. AW31-3R TaxID=3445781 RepID=UPI003FA1083F